MPPDAYRAGNRDDFDRLYRETYPRIRFTLQGMLRNSGAAEDCAQEAFEKAFRAWSSWKADAPAEAWLHRIAVNVAVSHRRREHVREAAETIRRLGRPSHGRSADARLELLDALRRLPPREAAVIVLRHYHGYSNREIAFALRTPESTVASRLAAAKRHLFEILGEPVSLALQRTHR
jgi:RNA polymerase sigma factor (sigma-70 family)